MFAKARSKAAKQDTVPSSRWRRDSNNVRHGLDVAAKVYLNQILKRFSKTKMHSIRQKGVGQLGPTYVTNN